MYNFTEDEWKFIHQNYRENVLKFKRPKSGFVRDLRLKIEEQTDFLESDNFKLRLWHIVNAVETQPTCSHEDCNNRVGLNNDKSFDYVYPYRSYCSRKCMDTAVSIITIQDACNEKFGKGIYDFSRAAYNGMNEPIEVVCPKHQITFHSKPNNLINGDGYACPECKREYFQSKYSRKLDDWIELFRLVHGDRYDYSKVEQSANSREKVEIICPDHGSFYMEPFCHYTGKQGCPKCGFQNSRNVTVSEPEKQLYNWLVDNTNETVISNDRTVLNGKEIDIWIPDQNLGIEVNGVYWHSDKIKDRQYHAQKTDEANRKGVTLLHFYDFEIENRFDLVSSMIMDRLGKSKRIYARSCNVVELSDSETRYFLNENHLFGYCPNHYRLALEYKGEIVSFMGFSKPRMNSHYDFELIRFCNSKGYRVIGGASKLFKHFINMFEMKPSIISYSDRRYSKGHLYQKLGFVYSHKTSPNYSYFYKNQVYSRMKFQKHKLKNMKSYSEEKSEKQIMDEEGYLRLYDSGNDVWVMND